MADPTSEVILRAENLTKHYPIRGGVLRRTVGHVRALEGVSFDLHAGETLGVVGESGCGKSTLGRMLMRLEEPTAGRLEYDGTDLYSLSRREMRRRRRDIQIVFQDPYTSLNPRKTVADLIGEPFDVHPDAVPKSGRKARVQELMELVGLSPEHINRFPHQFSGGQRQRIGIARGIALNPRILVCDEPVSALDVSVQAQVVNVMERLQDELTLHVRREHLLNVVRLLRDDPSLSFELCSGVSGMHYPGDAGAELHAVYHLLSMTHNRRLRLEVSCPDADPQLPSVVAAYPTADWHERETYDMFGIVFVGHPALARILMPDDWPGHPQRKDYPLGGVPVEYKGGTVPPPDQRRAYN